MPFNKPNPPLRSWRWTTIAAALLLVTSPAELRAVELAKPSAKQIAFADWEVGAFIHYGMNPYSGQEHGDGQAPPSVFNPTEFDVSSGC